jgi:hypothetical protein
MPLFVEQIAHEQALHPSLDEVMGQRAIGFAESEQKWRDHRAVKWREARKKISLYNDADRAVIRRLWNDAPYPADPAYLLGMLRDVESGRISLKANPPWHPTDEKIQQGRAALARYDERRSVVAPIISTRQPQQSAPKDSWGMMGRGIRLCRTD